MKKQVKKQRQTQAPIKRDAFTLMRIQPKTIGQNKMMEEYQDGMNVIGYGSAGSGKSYIACYLALKDLFEKEKGKIIIVRSAVPTRDQGYLPGSLEEKQAVYQLPYINIVNELCQNGAAWEILTKKGQIQFMTTSYIRGITLDDAVVIVDEIQNADAKEIESVLTRVGLNTQVIICGDTRQNDLDRKRQKSGFQWLLSVAERMEEWFALIEFRPDDIVRSGFVRDFIIAVEEMENG